MTNLGSSDTEYYERGVTLVEEHRGKLEIALKVAIRDREDLAVAYTPGVAEPTRRVCADKSLQYRYTARGSQVAVVTDGSAVLGLGNVGPEAAQVVMEGKAALLKVFGGVDAFPLCLGTQDPEEIVSAVRAVEPTFGLIFLEDIAAPRCFLIEERLERELAIPVFHDDQHGTAIAVAAGLINALKVTGRTLPGSRVVLSGAGAAGIATANLLLAMGCRELCLCDRQGALYAGRTANMNPWKARLAERLGTAGPRTLEQCLAGADIFIGVSSAGLVTRDMARSMNKNPVIFALANPVPEIMPAEALAAGAAVVATGRSDFPNMANNLLAFPGVVRGTLAARARRVSMEMKLAAARAIADFVSPAELRADMVLPDPLRHELAEAVSEAVARAAPQVN